MKNFRAGARFAQAERRKLLPADEQPRSRTDVIEDQIDRLRSGLLEIGQDPQRPNADPNWERIKTRRISKAKILAVRQLRQKVAVNGRPRKELFKRWKRLFTAGWHQEPIEMAGLMIDCARGLEEPLRDVVNKGPTYFWTLVSSLSKPSDSASGVVAIPKVKVGLVFDEVRSMVPDMDASEK